MRVHAWKTFPRPVSPAPKGPTSASSKFWGKATVSATLLAAVEGLAAETPSAAPAHAWRSPRANSAAALVDVSLASAASIMSVVVSLSADSTADLATVLSSAARTVAAVVAKPRSASPEPSASISSREARTTVAQAVLASRGRSASVVPASLVTTMTTTTNCASTASSWMPTPVAVTQLAPRTRGAWTAFVC